MDFVASVITPSLFAFCSQSLSSVCPFCSFSTFVALPMPLNFASVSQPDRVYAANRLGTMAACFLHVTDMSHMHLHPHLLDHSSPLTDGCLCVNLEPIAFEHEDLALFLLIFLVHSHVSCKSFPWICLKKLHSIRQFCVASHTHHSLICSLLHLGDFPWTSSNTTHIVDSVQQQTSISSFMLRHTNESPIQPLS